ncbi:CHAT domain-containing protein [Kalaharituber pfeilii]|nr:CHAT domain-containing protein [Kalaharituber pfeilii]
MDPFVPICPSNMALLTVLQGPTGVSSDISEVHEYLKLQLSPWEIEASLEPHKINGADTAQTIAKREAMYFWRVEEQLRQYNLTGDVKAIDIAINFLIETLEIPCDNHHAITTPHHLVVPLVAQLGQLYRLKWMVGSHIGDLERAKDFFKCALCLTEDGFPGRHEVQLRLGLCYMEWYKVGRCREDSDLRKAVWWVEKWRCHVDRGAAQEYWYAVVLLSELYCLKHENDGTQEDANQAIEYARKAVDMASQDPYTLINLGKVLLKTDPTGKNAQTVPGILDTLFKATGALGAAHPLDNFVRKVIGQFRRAPDLDPEAAMVLQSHNVAETKSFDDYDLDEQVLFFQIYVVPMVSNPPAAWDALALAERLIDRFRKTFTLEDCDTVLSILEQARRLGPTDNGTFDGLVNFYLGVAIMQRWLMRDEVESCAKALYHLYQAEQVLDHLPVELACRRAMLMVLSVLYKQSGDIYWLKLANQTMNLARWYKQPTETNPTFAAQLDTPDMMELKSIIASAEATGGCETAMVEIPFLDIAEIKRLLTTHWQKFPEPEHLSLAMSLSHLSMQQLDEETCLRNSLETLHSDGARTHERIRAAKIASNILITQEKYKEAFDVLSTADSLRCLLSNRHLRAENRELILSEVEATPASFMASLALQLGRPAYHALYHLEKSRGLIMSDMMDLLCDVSQVQEVDPALAMQIKNAQKMALMALRLRGKVDANELPLRLTHKGSLDNLERLIQRARVLPGLSDFMQPPTEAMLRTAAQLGPIVVFNATPLRSDAILITTGGVHTLPLPGLVWNDVIHYTNIFSMVLASSPNTLEKRNKMLKGLLEWLWKVAVEPVLRELGFKKTLGESTKATQLQRIWWVASAPLGNLPFHAAGIYRAKFSPKTNATLNYCVSSYVPTIKALLYTRRIQDAYQQPSKAVRLLAVAMPDTPGYSSLDGVLTEVEGIKQEFDVRRTGNRGASAHVYVENLVKPSSSDVISEMATADIIHFACHGVSGRLSPLDSHLLVMNDTANAAAPITVRQICEAPAQLRSAKLVYLSACSSAQISSPKLMDEGFHISTAFQLAGFQHAIGSMWETDDELSHTIALGFYRTLFSQTAPLEDRNISCALHSTIRGQLMTDHRLVKAPLLWAPYVHFGG